MILVRAQLQPAFIETVNFLHSLHANNHLVMERYAPTHEPRVPSLWNHFDVMLVAVREHSGELHKSAKHFSVGKKGHVRMENTQL